MKRKSVTLHLSTTSIRRYLINTSSPLTWWSSLGRRHPTLPVVLVDLTMCRILRKLNNDLRSTYADMGKGMVPALRGLWRAGDVQDTIKTGNAGIVSIRGRWQVREVPRSRREIMLTLALQMRLQVCTLASTTAINARLEVQEKGITDIKAMLQHVGQTVSMLQQERVRQHARSLLVHPQVEPDGFKSHTTSVGLHTQSQIHRYTHSSQVVANPTPAAVTFSILSPSTIFAYDQIKLRLEEYRRLLSSTSDTIELSTENGTIILCRKQASGMEAFLDQAESLLRDLIQSRNTSMIVVLHRLRDLAKVLDNIKLGKECRLAGDCALKLAMVLGQWSQEFQNELAETLALLAGLSVHQSRACAIFGKAVSICEELNAKDASVSSKMRLFTVLARAGCWSKNHPDNGAQWLKQAVQLITTGLPSTMVPPYLQSVIFNTYGDYLYALKQYAAALEVCQNAVTIQYKLVNDDPVKYTSSLVRSFTTIGDSHCKLGRYDDAIAAYKAAEEYCGVASAQDPLHYSALLAQILQKSEITLSNLNQVPGAHARHWTV